MGLALLFAITILMLLGQEFDSAQTPERLYTSDQAGPIPSGRRIRDHGVPVQGPVNDVYRPRADRWFQSIPPRTNLAYTLLYLLEIVEVARHLWAKPDPRVCPTWNRG